VEIVERSGRVAGLELAWRQAGEAPILYLHGVPTASWDWEPFLERTGGLAPDLPGFGRSAKPADFRYSIEGYADFLERFVATARLERFALVVHDWGAVGLALAQRFPERIERLVVMDAVPLLPGYRWHRVARVWRRPVAGELMMGFTTKLGFRLWSREANATPGPLPGPFIDRVFEHFDQGTQRAILKLYRSAPEDALARAGERLGELRCPALIVWGESDPYLDTRFARAYADALGGETHLELVEAGHWPWLDRPETVDRVARFLAGRPGSAAAPALG
jgi:pimeloyl-ACP methyl ester carboxylesterase